MAKLSWNEIRQHAIQFSLDWSGVSDEGMEAQSFWSNFFAVFGKQHRLLSSFEENVKSLKGTYHLIDLFWPGRLLAEHKSVGQSLEKSETQAFQYIGDLASSNREDEIPQFVVVSDFARIVLYDLEPEDGDGVFEFPLRDFHKHVKRFAFFIGQRTHRFDEEDPANLKAVGIMADLHDAIEQGNYTGTDLERLLVRLLFCLFADDTGIFETSQFKLFIENHTKEDGSDLGAQLNHLFGVLDTPQDQRVNNLEEDIADFPCINGKLFADRLGIAGFNRKMRERLVEACRFDWSRISPAIFGSLFQGIMAYKERRQIGSHYTSERDILKLIRPLFLDELQAEFEQIRHVSRKGRRNKRLRALRERLTKLSFLDPACGCGNFLVIAYRELRRLEHRVLDVLYNFSAHGKELDLEEEGHASRVNVNQFYGIEICEWPARIAETALWLTDHQMNTELSLSTGSMYKRIPLKAAPHIRCDNALRMDWNDLLPADECSYVLGNPPFVGKQHQTREQKEDMWAITGNIEGSDVLDYVTCWYFVAARYMGDNSIPCAFVSTSSIAHGEQVGVLWHELFKFNLRIHFARRTFAWKCEAKGSAHLNVVIIGFAKNEPNAPRLFDYESMGGSPKEIYAHSINPYLIDAPFIRVVKRHQLISGAPRMNVGSTPNDGGHLILSREEKDEILRNEPDLARYIRPFLGILGFMKGLERFCFWLVDAPPHILTTSKELKERLKKVRDLRSKSKTAATRRLAKTPALFGQIRQPATEYIAIPGISLEQNSFIPIAFIPPQVIGSKSIYQIPGASIFDFGLLQSTMHMAWIRAVAGRLKFHIRYSSSLVYNNFPWPMDASEAQQSEVEAWAQKVLDVRQGYLDNGSTLADLYDPLFMPGPLLRAHRELDGAVDRCYGETIFFTERQRVDFLFELYETLTASLATSAPAKKIRRRRKKKSET